MSMIHDSTFEEEVRTAHLDEAHVGDIQGTWGTIRRGDTAVRRTWFARLLTLLVIMGPGLVLIRSGDPIPLDGVVKLGTASVNQAAITGENQAIPSSREH